MDSCRRKTLKEPFFATDHIWLSDVWEPLLDYFWKQRLVQPDCNLTIGKDLVEFGAKTNVPNLAEQVQLPQFDKRFPAANYVRKVRKLRKKSQKTESEKLHCYEMASIVTQAVSRFLREWLSPSRMSLIHCEDWRCALDLWLWAFPYADCSSATKESEREPDPFDVYKKGKNSAFS